MDINFQIRALKSQIENMKLQIENIEIQNDNILMMNNPQKGEQLLNLSIQMLNAGIQTFDIGEKYMIMNTSKFYEPLRQISEQINSIIKKYDMEQMMQQQIMMQQQMRMQQQMLLQQQIIQQNLMEKPMIQQDNYEYKNIIFRTSRGKNVNITVKFGTKVKELINQYIDKYEVNSKKFRFLFNGDIIDKDEQRVVENFFRYNTNPYIMVLEI